MIKERGRLLTEGNFKEHKVVSDKITKLIEQKKEKFCRPVVAFIIFDNQECQERCLEELLTSESLIGTI